MGFEVTIKKNRGIHKNNLQKSWQFNEYFINLTLDSD